MSEAPRCLVRSRRRPALVGGRPHGRALAGGATAAEHHVASDGPGAPRPAARTLRAEGHLARPRLAARRQSPRRPPPLPFGEVRDPPFEMRLIRLKHTWPCHTGPHDVCDRRWLSARHAFCTAGCYRGRRGEMRSRTPIGARLQTGRGSRTQRFPQAFPPFNLDSCKSRCQKACRAESQRLGRRRPEGGRREQVCFSRMSPK